LVNTLVSSVSVQLARSNVILTFSFLDTLWVEQGCCIPKYEIKADGSVINPFFLGTNASGKLDCGYTGDFAPQEVSFELKEYDTGLRLADTRMVDPQGPTLLHL